MSTGVGEVRIRSTGKGFVYMTRFGLLGKARLLPKISSGPKGSTVKPPL